MCDPVLNLPFKIDSHSRSIGCILILSTELIIQRPRHAALQCSLLNIQISVRIVSNHRGIIALGQLKSDRSIHQNVRIGISIQKLVIIIRPFVIIGLSKFHRSRCRCRTALIDIERRILCIIIEGVRGRRREGYLRIAVGSSIFVASLRSGIEIGIQIKHSVFIRMLCHICFQRLLLGFVQCIDSDGISLLDGLPHAVLKLYRIEHVNGIRIGNR